MDTTPLSRSLPVTARLLMLLGCGLAPLVAGCATEPITGRSHIMLISEDEANAMGVQAYQETLSDAELSADPAQIALVERVGTRIARVTDELLAEEGREPFEWEFKVIDAPDVANAFALPGGKVAVYTGILPITKDENGLAVVLGHEVAHAYARHGAKRVSEEVAAQFGLAAVGIAVEEVLDGENSTDMAQVAMLALGAADHFGRRLPFSRGDESAADEIGLILMARAGYDPRAAVDFWSRMQSAGGGGPPEFLSTHPAPGSRIEHIQELMPRALEEYEKAKS